MTPPLHQRETALRARLLADARALIDAGHFRTAAQKIGELRLHLERSFEGGGGDERLHTREMDALAEVWDDLSESDRAASLTAIDRLRRLLVDELAHELEPTHQPLLG
ncbi:MAG: hypothetical protein JNJ54_02065 [Myxococcaceae bacterium]|nr:hypothetical protein [Myxococcaceae bacterium]